MKNLWSPWRLEYVQDPKKKSPEGGCIFCELSGADLNEKSLVLFRDNEAFVVMNRFPYSNGHLLLIPNQHVKKYTDLTPNLVQKLSLWQQKCVQVLENEFSAQGFNVGANLGEAAGAGIAGHLHFHVVPRWNGDTNFMPVIGELKSIPDHLEYAYSRLQKPLQNILGESS